MLTWQAKKNIPVFSIDEEIDGITYIGSNNYAVGEMAAAFMAKNLPESAEVSVKSLGKGFSDYLTELRIEHIKERLTTTSEKIKNIAAAEGFSDYQYFVKVFKKNTGLTPGQYREKFLS